MRAPLLLITYVLTLALSLAAPLGASPIGLTFEEPTSAPVSQSEPYPCIFGDPACKNPAGFDHLVLPVNVTVYDVYYEYKLGDIVSALGGDTVFAVAFAMNTATGKPPEVLERFSMSVDETLVALWDVPTSMFSYNAANPSDSRLLGFNLNGYDADATVRFSMLMSNLSGGREQVFLQATGSGDPGEVPEPSSLILLGSALMGVYFIGKKRVRR